MSTEYCNCTKEIPARVLEKVKNDDGYVNPGEVKFENEAIMFVDNQGPGVQPYFKLVVHHESRNGKPKKTKICMSCSYCPFCGQKWVSKENQ